MDLNVCFENKYDHFSFESANNILNEHHNGLSKNFEEKLQYFTATTKMEFDRFRDSTVYTGSGGLALYYFVCSLRYVNKKGMLKKSMDYINLKYLKEKSISFLGGVAGPLALSTVISYQLGHNHPSNVYEYETYAQRLISLSSQMHDSPDELLYGKSGYLYALLFVNKYTSGNQVIPSSHIEMVTNAILNSGKQFASRIKAECPLMWKWHDKIYLGAAHGVAGILYMLLQARTFINVMEMQSFIKPTLDWLMRQQFPSGNFPSSLNSSSGDKLVQWCHGAPGFVPLCILASQVFEDEKYMKIALQLGDVIWDRGLCKKGYSICHGVSGNAYAFLQLYQATKNPLHLYRACCFMEWCLTERPGTEQRQPDRPTSLFEGIVGRLYLAEELQYALDSKFPAFCL